MTNDVECVFIYLFAICVFSLGRYLSISFAHFLIGWFYLCQVLSVLCVFWIQVLFFYMSLFCFFLIQVLFQKYVLQMFFPSLGLVFSFSMALTEKIFQSEWSSEKIFILMKFSLLTYSFMYTGFVSYIRNLCLTQNYKINNILLTSIINVLLIKLKYFLMFYSRSFIILSFMFRSMTNFEFILYVMYYVSQRFLFFGCGEFWTCSYLIVLASFVEKMTLSPLSCLCIFVKNQLPTYVGYFWTLFYSID